MGVGLEKVADFAGTPSRRGTLWGVIVSWSNEPRGQSEGPIASESLCARDSAVRGGSNSARDRPARHDPNIGSTALECEMTLDFESKPTVEAHVGLR